MATTNPHHELGRRGEELAVKYLRRQQLALLYRNWHCRAGEVDILLTDGRQLVACEVKTRSDTTFGTPAEAVDDEKARRVRAAAMNFLAVNKVPYVDVRYDIVAILWPPHSRPRVKHLPGSF
jgi:putative endonuclease